MTRLSRLQTQFSKTAKIKTKFVEARIHETRTRRDERAARQRRSAREALLFSLTYKCYYTPSYKVVCNSSNFRGGTKLLCRARETMVTGPGRGEAGPVVLGRHGPGGVSVASTASPYLVPPRQRKGAPTGLNSRVGCFSRTPLLQAPCQPRWPTCGPLWGPHRPPESPVG